MKEITRPPQSDTCENVGPENPGDANAIARPESPSPAPNRWRNHLPWSFSCSAAPSSTTAATTGERGVIVDSSSLYRFFGASLWESVRPFLAAGMVVTVVAFALGHWAGSHRAERKWREALGVHGNPSREAVSQIFRRTSDYYYSLGYSSASSDMLIPNAEFVDVTTGKKFKVVEQPREE